MEMKLHSEKQSKATSFIQTSNKSYNLSERKDQETPPQHIKKAENYHVKQAWRDVRTRGVLFQLHLIEWNSSRIIQSGEQSEWNWKRDSA